MLPGPKIVPLADDGKTTFGTSSMKNCQRNKKEAACQKKNTQFLVPSMNNY